MTGRSRTTFGKLQRQREKQAKAKAKRDQRQASASSDRSDGPPAPEPQPSESPEVVLELVGDLHRRFENAEISFEDYEVEKAALLGRLTIE